MEILKKLENNGVHIRYDDLVKICKKYQIIELSVFGSSIRDDFNDNSDIDFLVSFEPTSRLSLYDIVDLKDDFKDLLNREIDIVEKEAMKNPIRKKRILSTREVIYVHS